MKGFLVLAFFCIQFAAAQSKINCNQTVVSQEDNTVFNVASLTEKPEFPGGNNGLFSFINSNFHTDNPDLNGKVYVAFIIEKDGKLSDIKVIRDIGHGTKEETIRILKLLPKWSPGKINGVIVRSLYSIPVTVKNGVGGNNAQAETVHILDKKSSPIKTK